MNSAVWLILVVMAAVMWASTSLLYKAGVPADREEHLCLKFSVCIGFVFFVIAILYLAIREESFSIWESAVRYWPMTVFGPVYAVVNTISFNGYIYNEASVESPIEGISCGMSTLLLIAVYIILGRVDSISELLTPVRTVGILFITMSIILLAIVRNRKNRASGKYQTRWMIQGLGTLIFPVLFALVDGLETIVTGICLDTTYGYSMPEGDSIIIIGMEYALFAAGCWIYIAYKERKPYNPFTGRSAPRMLGAVADNVGIVIYSYAMAMDSVTTDIIVAVYPVLVMLGGRAIMKEKVSADQLIFLLGVVAGSIMIIADTVL